MARYEGKFEADGSEPLALDDLLGLLRTRSSAPSLDGARACYLSSSDGWREAVKMLGGAFADVGAVDDTSKK